MLREVEELLARGYRSITLLGQNVNSYGRDRPGAEPTFAALLGEVGARCDAAAQKVWVYFTSPHPAEMSPAVLERIAEHDSLAKQIHLPMQSADEVLIRMNRNHRLDQYRAVVENIRATLPTATLFTDIIVGFCGETEEQFERTRLAMEEFAFDMAYIAMYSPRPGAAAARWPDDVPQAEKKRRRQILSDVLQETALRHNRRWEARTVEVLVEAEDRKPGLLIGRTEGRVPVRFAGAADLIGNHGWVALGSHPPRAPTDPDVQNSRIRLLGVEVSLPAVQSVHDSRCCKRVPGQEPSKRLPVPVSGMGASTQPFPPQAFHLAAEATQRPRVAGHAVVGVVAPQLAIQLPVLVSHPPVSVPAAPLADSLQRAAEAILRRLAFDRPASGSAFPP